MAPHLLKRYLFSKKGFTELFLQSCFYRVSIPYRNRFQPKNFVITKKTNLLFALIHYTLIHSHFNYGLAVWGSTYPTYLNKLKLLQNKAIRIVTSSHMSISSKSLYIKTNILALPKLFEFETAKIVYFYNFNLLPKIFDN